MIKTFKHGNYFYRFKCKLNDGHCWWKCDLKDWDVHINELSCVDSVVMTSDKFTRKQLLNAFFEQDYDRDFYKQGA